MAIITFAALVAKAYMAMGVLALMATRAWIEFANLHCITGIAWGW